MTTETTEGGTWLSRTDIRKRWGCSRTTVYHAEKDGTLPAPVRLARGIERWPLAEIEAVEERAKGARKAGK